MGRERAVYNMNSETRGLLFAAQNDYMGARLLLYRCLLFPAGLLVHQCSEKALKAILVENGYSLECCKNSLRHDLVLIGEKAARSVRSFAGSSWTNFFARIGKGFQFRYMDSLQDYISADSNGRIVSIDDAYVLDNLLGDVHRALAVSATELGSLPLHTQLKGDKDLAELIMKDNKRVPDLVTTDQYTEEDNTEDRDLVLPEGLAPSGGDAVRSVIYKPRE